MKFLLLILSISCQQYSLLVSASAECVRLPAVKEPYLDQVYTNSYIACNLNNFKIYI